MAFNIFFLVAFAFFCLYGFFLQSFTITTTIHRFSRRSTISLTQEDLIVDNVPCFLLVLVLFPHDGELKLAWRAHSGACHVQLAMHACHTQMFFRVWPCDLLMMVRANGCLTGKCLRCHLSGYSPNFGMKVILGISTSRSEPTILHSSSLFDCTLEH